jgi:hypothetical protein
LQSGHSVAASSCVAGATFLCVASSRVGIRSSPSRSHRGRSASRARTVSVRDAPPHALSSRAVGRTTRTSVIMMASAPTRSDGRLHKLHGHLHDGCTYSGQCTSTSRVLSLLTAENTVLHWNLPANCCDGWSCAAGQDSHAVHPRAEQVALHHPVRLRLGRRLAIGGGA